MPFPGCRAEEHPLIDRREVLRAGGLTLLGAGLTDRLRLEAQASPAPSRRSRAKAVVFIFPSGGHSQHETFDPKPEAPEGIRGQYGTVQTSLPGQVIGRTDRQGRQPVTGAYTPADLAATIFHLFGVGPDAEFHDGQGRPYRIVCGTPIGPLVG